MRALHSSSLLCAWSVHEGRRANCSGGSWISSGPVRPRCTSSGHHDACQRTHECKRVVNVYLSACML
eukprot:1488790-Amphidinium_carterae.2